MEPKRGPGGVNTTSGVYKVPGAVGIEERVFPRGEGTVKCPNCGRMHKVKAAFIQGHVDADGNFLMSCGECER